MTVYPFTFSVVSNEIDEDMEIVVDVAKDLGIGAIELGSVWLKPPTQLTSQEVDRIETLVQQAGMRINMILSTCLKSVRVANVPEGQVGRSIEFQDHMEDLRRAIALAKQFDATVRIFSFRRENMIELGNSSPRLPQGGTIARDSMRKVVEGLSVACEIAARAGVTLALENVRSCYANTGTNTQRIVDAVGAHNLKIIWDPANSFVSGQEAFPEGYEELEMSLLVDVHIKDAKLRDAALGWTDWVCVGDGEVNYPGQLAALARDGYRGTLTVETHWQPREYATRKTFDGILQALTAAFSSG